jgi:hypothetical protein
MTTSKTNPSRKGKQQAFKQHAKDQANKASSGPRTQIVPNVLWESNDFLLLRGDLLEAYNKTVEVIYHGLQQLGQIYQQIVAMNIKGDNNPDGKIKIKYQWNNGEEVSEQELEVFKRKMGEIQALQQKQQAELQQKAALINGEKEQETKSKLVDAQGAPISKEALEKGTKIIS